MQKIDFLWWIIIILFLITFWPAGIFIMYRFLTKNKAAALRNSFVVKGFGVFFFILTAVMILLTIFDGKTDVLNSVYGIGFYLVSSIGMFIYSGKFKKFGELCQKVNDIISKEDTMKFEALGKVLNMSEKDTERLVWKLISWGSIKGYRINRVGHIIYKEKQ